MRGVVEPWRDRHKSWLWVEKSNSRVELEDGPKEETETGKYQDGRWGAGRRRYHGSAASVVLPLTARDEEGMRYR